MKGFIVHVIKYFKIYYLTNIKVYLLDKHLNIFKEGIEKAHPSIEPCHNICSY